MKAERFGLSPEEMALDKILRLPEQRITAVFGVPAIVVGLGAGLERSTFANFKEAREAFTETVLVPLWRELAETITTQLGPDFGLKPGQRFEYDISEVRALQEDVTALYTRTISAYKEGVLTLQESRQALGQDPEPQGDLKPAPVAPALPGKPGDPQPPEVGKAWVAEMAKKWQERARLPESSIAQP
jgi:phage portal protein BeeE